MTTNDVRYEVADDGVATLTFNRPEVMNAIRPGMTVEILDAVADARTNDDVRCLLITGEGRGFCASCGETPFCTEQRAVYAPLLSAERGS